MTPHPPPSIGEIIGALLFVTLIFSFFLFIWWLISADYPSDPEIRSNVDYHLGKGHTQSTEYEGGLPWLGGGYKTVWKDKDGNKVS